MARVTVEDCVDKITNRFELVMIAAQRARKIGSGASLTIDRDNDKNPVVSLREIAEQTVEPEELKEELIRSHQRMIAYEDDDDDSIDLMDGEEEWGSMAAGGGDKKPAEGMYAEDDVSEDDGDDDNTPSLADLAGAPMEEDDA